MPTTNIKITATDKTQRAFQSAQRSVGGLKKSIVGLKGAIGLLFGAVAIGKLTSFQSNLINTADSIGKLSSRLDVATDKVQGLNFSAQLAGSNVEEMQRNIQKFTYSIGQARIGTKAQADAFERLGINLKKQNGDWKHHTQIFNEVADAYARTSDKTAVLTSAQILFGRGGREMVNMLSGGSPQLEKFFNLLKKTGGVMSGEFIDASENLNDSMTLWGKIMDGNTTRILTPFIEKILEISDAMFEMKGINPLELSSMKKLIRNYNELEVEIRGYKKELKEGIPWYKKMMRVSIESTKQELGDAIKKQNAVTMMMLEQTKLAEQKKAIAKASKEQTKEEVEEINQISLAQQKMYTKELELAEKNALAKKQLSREEKARENALILEITSFRRTQEEQRTFDIRMEGERRLEVVREFLKMQNATNIENDALMIQQRLATAEKLKQIDQEKRDSSIQTSKDMIVQMGSANKSWFQANKALGIAETLMATYQAATKALTIQPPWVGISYASVITGLGLANVNRIRQQKYEPRAMGGNVNAGQTYLVGEQGRELFTPNQSGHITPNHELGTTVNFNITTNDAQGFDDLLQDRRGMIVSMINRASNENGRGNLI